MLLSVKAKADAIDDYDDHLALDFLSLPFLPAWHPYSHLHRYS